jgi:hypothetical protein
VRRHGKEGVRGQTRKRADDQRPHANYRASRNEATETLQPCKDAHSK